MAYIRDLVKIVQPELRKKIESEQYLLSKRLISLKLLYDLDQEDMAELGEVNINTYLKMEYTDLSISKEKYKELINKIEKKVKEK